MTTDNKAARLHQAWLRSTSSSKNKGHCGVSRRASAGAALLICGTLPLLLGGPGIVGAILGLALGAGLLAIAWRRLRGVTGDVCGAVGEVAETGFLIGIATAGGAA